MIDGINILTQKIIYTPNIFFVVVVVLLALLFMIFLVLFSVDNEKKFLIIACFCFFLLIICVLNAYSQNDNFFTSPKKIQYTIEIIDEKAYKWLIENNYITLNKIYDNKNIYLIEGDYINEDNN